MLTGIIADQERTVEIRITRVFAPIVTPFRLADGEVDLPWLGRHVAYLKAHGCTGVIPCGTNGKAASLSVAERQAVVETTMASPATCP